MSKKQKTKTGQAKKKKSSDYDSAWKDVIEILFEAFLEFFFPHIHRDVDFSKGIEILSSELRKITPAGKTGQRHSDVLVKVHLKDGSQKCFCIFIHVEVQGTKEDDFMLRMFIYYYRTFDKYRQEGTEVISLAILTDENKNWRPVEYASGRWGFDLRMQIPVIKLIDYKNNRELMEKVETSDNPMAMVVKAQLKSYELKRADDRKKSTVKWELIRQCYKKGYTKKQINALLKFIDWIIRLPEDLDRELSGEIIKLEEEYKMAYVTSWEKIAKKDGIKIGEERGVERGVKIGEKRGEERGVERGVKIGEEKGKVETARKLIKRGIDIEIIAEATGFSKEEIEKFAANDHYEYPVNR